MKFQSTIPHTHFLKNSPCSQFNVYGGFQNKNLCIYPQSHIRDIQMSITPISRKQFRNLTPKLITAEQCGSYWGVNRTERLQRVLESILISYLGAWLAWFLSFMVGSFISSIVGTCLLFNWIYMPFLYAKRKNGIMTSTQKSLHYSIMLGKVHSVRKIRQQAAKTIGGISQEYLAFVMSDENHRELEVITHWKDDYHVIRRGMTCSTMLVANDDSFRSVIHATEIYVPICNLWVGEYPYLKQKEFGRLVNDLIDNRADETGDFNMSKLMMQPQAF